MAILLCGITMSHYAHFNLSPIGQLAAQQIFRVLALVAGKEILSLALLNPWRTVCVFGWGGLGGTK